MGLKSQNIIYSAGSLFSLPVMALRRDMGAEGFGIYIMLLELLTLNNGRLSADYHLYALNLNVEEEDVRRVAEEYDLFKIFVDERGERVIIEPNIEARVEAAEELKARRAAAAHSRWKKRSTPMGKKSEERKSNFEDNKRKALEMNHNEVDSCSQSSALYDYVADTELILESEEWVKNEGERLGLDPLTLKEVFREFMKFTNSRRASYAGRQEYLQHFVRWSSGAGLDAAMEKVNEHRQARLIASRQEKAREERNREWDERARKAVKPWEYIRMRGYDPAKVTNMMNISDPDWRAKNPPTLPTFATVEELRRALG